MAYKFDCKYFSGYKPCQFKRQCEGCPNYTPVRQNILIISLEALGAVLRSTCLLTPIKRKYPSSHITWVTLPGAHHLLTHNPLIDRVIKLQPETISVLQYLKFDVLFAVDKSLQAGALAEQTHATLKFGFGLTENGKIRPLSDEALYQFDVGLDDDLKFFRNQKPETQQITETMGLRWKRDEYVYAFSQEEKEVLAQIRQSLAEGAEGVIGYNTGCSTLYPYKKLTVSKSIELIKRWRDQHPKWKVALLGGPEDESRQEEIKSAFADDFFVVNTPTNQGLRAGMLWMAAADIVFTGCSLGLHMAVSLKKHVVVWFGVSCPQEIDLYERGFKILADVSCSPCWKKSCQNEPKCFDSVDVKKVLDRFKEIITKKSYLGVQ